MISENDWADESGDLLLAVTPVDISNPEHVATTVRVMNQTFAAIARKHDAKFDANGLCGNLNALITGQMYGDLYHARWKDCAEEICVGAAWGWRTYGFTPNDVLVKCEYTEDLALPNLRDVVRAMPDGAEFPDENLAQCFERISLRNMRKNRGAHYRVGEVNLTNTTMVRQLNGNGALIGGPNSGIVEFQRFPNDLMNNFPMNAQAIPIRCNGIIDENNFLVRVGAGEHYKRFVVTHGQATGKGLSRVDVHSCNNDLPVDKPVQQSMVASGLLAIKRGVEERRWGEKKEIQYPSSITQLLQSRPELAAVLYPKGKSISLPTASRPTFPAPAPEAHVFIHGNEALLDGMYAAGGVERVYGKMPMKPVVNILTPG
jgi:hypothetical protein